MNRAVMTMLAVATAMGPMGGVGRGKPKEKPPRKDDEEAKRRAEEKRARKGKKNLEGEQK